MTKTLGTVAIVIICVLMLPVAIGLIGGIFGAVIGVFGAVFGAIFGIIGGLFGAIFGFIGWLFDTLFGWNHWDGPSHFFDCNILTWVAIVIIVALAVRSRKK